MVDNECPDCKIEMKELKEFDGKYNNFDKAYYCKRCGRIYYTRTQEVAA